MTLAFWLAAADFADGDGDRPRSRRSGVRDKVRAPINEADEAIVARIRDDDIAAFEELYRGYYPAMVGYATPAVGDIDTARELAADIFLSIWERRHKWCVETSIATYLYQSLRHRILNARRNDAVHARHRDSAASLGNSLGMATSAIAADDLMIQCERAERVWHAVDALPEPRRTILRLRWIEQLSFQEIAVIVGTSAAAVQMQLSRALKTLRETLPKILGD